MEQEHLKSIIGSAVLMLIAIIYGYNAMSIPSDTTAFDERFKSNTLPILLAICLFIITASTIIDALYKHTQVESTELMEDAVWANLNWPMLGKLTLLMAAYVFVFNNLGFLISGVLFLFCGFLILGEQRKWLGLIVATGIVGGLWLLLTQVFELHLASGEWILAVGND